MNPDYEKIAALIVDSGILVTAAELHGLISGQISAGASFPLHQITWQLLNCEGECSSIIEQLIERLSKTIIEQIKSGEFTFQPLLPNDEEELGLRVYALGKWCEGFSVGFGAGFAKSDQAMLDETREVINDFVKIAEIEDSIDEELEQNEEDYMELIEYVRMAVVIVFDQNASHVVENQNSH